jgi:hypothetical protein
MVRALLAAAGGLLLGAALGWFAAFLLQPPQKADSGWVQYPTLADAAAPGTQGPTVEDIQGRYFTLMGLLLGGGLGALTGAVVGLAGTIARRHPTSGQPNR